MIAIFGVFCQLPLLKKFAKKLPFLLKTSFMIQFMHTCAAGLPDFS
jgi:hypothetical protein